MNREMILLKIIDTPTGELCRRWKLTPAGGLIIKVKALARLCALMTVASSLPAGGIEVVA